MENEKVNETNYQYAILKYSNLKMYYYESHDNFDIVYSKLCSLCERFDSFCYDKGEWVLNDRQTDKIQDTDKKTVGLDYKAQYNNLKEHLEKNISQLHLDNSNVIKFINDGMSEGNNIKIIIGFVKKEVYRGFISMIDNLLSRH